MKYQHPQDLPRYEAPARERLERLAQFVEAVAPEDLTFTKWYGHGKGCPIGLAAATDSWFQAQGLGLRHNEILKECQPVYLDFQDWRAVTKFFALSMENAHNLFSWEGYEGELRPHPMRVAENICYHLTSTAPEWRWRRTRETSRGAATGEPRCPSTASTEGFDTADPKKAKASLEELG